MKKVAIASCRRYEKAELREAILAVIDNSDFPSLEGKSVLLKTNILSDSSPDKHITTNPEFVRCLAEICHERGAEKVYIGDSPGLPGPGFKGEGCRIAEVCRDTGSIWADFSKKTVSRKVWQNIEVPIASIVFDADIVISVPKMKTHQLMYATGAVKNMFGIIPGLNKSPMHLRARSPENFAKFLLSLYEARKPDYAIMDGIIAMEGAGPANGTPRQMGMVIGSECSVSVDFAQAIVMGYDPMDIPILKEAKRQDKKAGAIEYTLQKAEDLIVPDFRRIEVKKKGLISALILPFFSRGFDRRKAAKRQAPIFDISRCRKCRRCVDICPASALSLDTGSIKIDNERCIRCYCCHEMCPFDAIKID